MSCRPIQIKNVTNERDHEERTRVRSRREKEVWGHAFKFRKAPGGLPGLGSRKGGLVLSNTIIDGEKRDLEGNISGLETQRAATDKQV